MSDGSNPKGLGAVLENQGVKYLLPTYADMHGRSKSKMVPVSHYERMLGGSELCTGAAVEGIEALGG